MVIIREATETDYETLCTLNKELLFYQHNVNPDNRYDDNKIKSSNATLKTYLERDYSIMYIAFLDGEAVGFIHGTIDPKPQSHIQAYVQHLFVVSSKRGEGIGSKLMDKLQNYFDKHNVSPGLTLDYTNANKKTINFYTKRGYKVNKVEGKVAYLVYD